MNERSTLAEKQAYYRFSEHPFRFKDAPVLAKPVVDAMRIHKLDRAYRFVWGGLVLVREEPNSTQFTIARGSRAAGHDVHGTFLPKYLYVRAQQARGYCYYDSLNRKISGFTRESLVPKEYLARVDYRYVDFGMLYWFLEQRANAQDLIKAKIYDRSEQVPESEWVCVMRMETKQGRYYEPGLELIPVLQKREWENRNADLKDVAQEMMQRTAKDRMMKEYKENLAGKKEFDTLFDDIWRRAERNPTYSR